MEELLKKAVIHPSQFIEHNQLAAFNISLTDFSLESDDAATQTRFFKPFSAGSNRRVPQTLLSVGS
jgi:hypothetical protein